MASLAIPQMIANAATAAGVPAALAVQVAQQESGFNPSAMGSKGELGLFQLMPSTAAQYGVTDPMDPAQNTQGALAYLSDLYSEFGSWAAALTAYNWGPGNVQTYGAAAAPASTQLYVANALAAAGLTAGAAASAASASAAPGASSASADQGTFDASLLPAITQTGVMPAPAADGSAILALVLIAAGIFFGAQLLFGES